MTAINLKKEISGDIDSAIERVTTALKEQGFGVLTRIDFHTKIKEKLGKDVPPTVILGACNPKLAFEAQQMCPEVTALLPCNAVVRSVGQGRISVELVKPTALMRILDDPKLVELATSADELLEQALEKIR